MIYIQFYKQKNSLINEDLVRPNIVNMQTVDFNDWCVRMAKGSTVTAADVAAVMQQIEDKQYAKPFEGDGRTIYKIGVNFSSESRRMTEWKLN